MYNSILAFLTPHNTRGGLIAALIGTALLPLRPLPHILFS
jgi:hypothetical protein